MIIFQNSPREFFRHHVESRPSYGHRPLGSSMGLRTSSMISFLGVLISPTMGCPFGADRSPCSPRISEHGVFTQWDFSRMWIHGKADEKNAGWKRWIIVANLIAEISEGSSLGSIVFPVAILGSKVKSQSTCWPHASKMSRCLVGPTYSSL